MVLSTMPGQASMIQGDSQPMQVLGHSQSMFVFLSWNDFPGLILGPSLKILLGDAIVCWRAYVIWQGNRLVMVVSVMLLLATFGM